MLTALVPQIGLAKRTRSLFSLRDRELPELEQDLPDEVGNIPDDDDSLWGDWKVGFMWEGARNIT